MEVLKEVFSLAETKLTYETLTLIISLASFFVSMNALYKNRKTLTVTWSELQPIPSGSIFVYSGNVECETYGEGFLCTIDIVNPSPNDIAFFDLRAFDSKPNRNTYLLTRKTLLPIYKNARIYRNHNANNFELEIPEKGYGILKASSFTKLDIFVLPNEHIGNAINISFKIAVKSYFKRDKFAVTNRKQYKFYRRRYDISEWKKGPLVE